ncbi:formimidoylglutamase [Constantimarinum furrinae]|uniref:Arginase family hydrolase, arginase/agmainase/formiminoglutamate hydrolase n=1 Tax=Constantimarinum furrinae TaxID=2562285 RepID=A0A7G8PRU5_9FLAO|nr:formimidoylglutamase [Constantimarinum furrinae]QNJ97061.1 Arginase family hydrolase, arginase/agmainase/formiminoglutamate hydrolase [Constantimarinum furrinae]
MIEFLSPVSKSVIAHREVLPPGVLGKQIKIHKTAGDLPDIGNAKFALLGIKENRNDINFMGESLSFDAFRKTFYALFPGNWNHSIVDLGDIEKGETVEDTYFAVKTVLAALHAKRIIPLVLGGSQDLLYAQYRSYDDNGSMVNLVNIDRNFDLGDAEKEISNASYVGKIIVDKPYNLFNYSALGYQSYFNPPQEIALMDKLYFDAYRLGELTTDITLVEPIMRNADIVALDVAAIKSSELSYKNSASPNGFDGREICAIARYAGISNRVSSFGIYELKDYTSAESAAMLIAQILWYFVEGVNFRVADEDFDNESHYTTYKVPVDEEVLVFKKSNKTGRWWIELPFISNVNNKLKRRTLLPCTYGEYLGATNQEIPERWYKARRKNEV